MSGIQFDYPESAHGDYVDRMIVAGSNPYYPSGSNQITFEFSDGVGGDLIIETTEGTINVIKAGREMGLFIEFLRKNHKNEDKT